MPDLIGGQVQASFPPIVQSIEYIKAGRLRALALTSATRSDLLPGVPAAAEFVPGYEATVWDALGAPAKTPIEIVGELNKAINAEGTVCRSGRRADADDAGRAGAIHCG